MQEAQYKLMHTTNHLQGDCCWNISSILIMERSCRNYLFTRMVHHSGQETQSSSPQPLAVMSFFPGTQLPRRLVLRGELVQTAVGCEFGMLQVVVDPA